MTQTLDPTLHQLSVYETELREIPLYQIAPSPWNPRDLFEEEALEQLAQSIKAYGLQTPISVRPLVQDAENEDGRTRYEIIAGERRFRACQMAGFTTIPALAQMRGMNDRDAVVLTLIENLHRVDLNVMEAAQGYKTLTGMGFSQERIAQIIGGSVPLVSNTLRLLKLPQAVQEMIAHGKLTRSHGLLLLPLVNIRGGATKAEQEAPCVLMAEMAAENGWPVKTLEANIVAEYPKAVKAEEATLPIAPNVPVNGTQMGQAAPDPLTPSGDNAPATHAFPIGYRFFQKNREHLGPLVITGHATPELDGSPSYLVDFLDPDGMTVVVGGRVPEREIATCQVDDGKLPDSDGDEIDGNTGKTINEEVNEEWEKGYGNVSDGAADKQEADGASVASDPPPPAQPVQADPAGTSAPMAAVPADTPDAARPVPVALSTPAISAPSVSAPVVGRDTSSTSPVTSKPFPPSQNYIAVNVDKHDLAELQRQGLWPLVEVLKRDSQQRATITSLEQKLRALEDDLYAAERQTYALLTEGQEVEVDIIDNGEWSPATIVKADAGQMRGHMMVTIRWKSTGTEAMARRCNVRLPESKPSQDHTFSIPVVNADSDVDGGFKPGDRVRSKISGKVGTVEVVKFWAGELTAKVNLDSGAAHLFTVSGLELLEEDPAAENAPEAAGAEPNDSDGDDTACFKCSALITFAATEELTKKPGCWSKDVSLKDGTTFTQNRELLCPTCAKARKKAAPVEEPAEGYQPRELAWDREEVPV